MPDVAIRHHRLQPQTQRTGIAIAQHVHPARVGRQIAADLARPLRRQCQREQAVYILGGGLDVLQHHPRLGHQHIFGGPDVADGFHALQRQDQRRRSLGQHLPPDQPRAAAIGHHAHLCGGTGADHGCHLLHRFRRHQHPRRALIAATRFFQIFRRKGSEHGIRQLPAQDGFKSTVSRVQH